MFKLFKLSNKKTKVFSILALVFVALQGVFEGFQTSMLARVISIIPTDGSAVNWTDYWTATSLLMVNAIMSLVFGALGSWIGTKASLLSAETIRHNMFYKAATLSFGDIDKVTTSSIITRITNDVQKYQIAVQLALALFVRAPIMFFYGIITSFVRFWMFGLMFLGIMTLIILCFVVVAKVIIPAFERVQYEIDNTNVVVRENVLGMKVIKSFCLEDKQAARFDVYNKRLRKQNTKAWIGFAIILPFINCIMNVAGAAIFMIAGSAIVHDNWIMKIDTVASIYEIFNLLMVTLASVIISCMVIINCVRAQPSCRRILEFLSIKSSITNSDKAKKLNPKNLDIEFKDVNFKYFADADRNVLKNINLKIKQGEMVGIVGPTGSGKTSLINLISRLYDIPKFCKGSLTIGDIPIKEIDLNSLQDNIGVVLQERILFSGTIKYNLLFGNQKAKDSDLMKAARIACADGIINKRKDKLNAVVEQRGRNFSGGQQQRLSIARTLVKKPNILILDDSTSALDMLTEAKLQHNIRTEMKGMTTIIVAQRISSVKDCDHIIVMDKGEIVGYGNHNSLRKNNQLYRSIVVSQMGKEGLTK